MQDNISSSWFKKINVDNHDEVVDALKYLGHWNGDDSAKSFCAATASFQSYSNVKVDGDFGYATGIALKGRFCACPDILPAGNNKWHINDLIVWHDMEDRLMGDEQEMYMEACDMWSQVCPLTFKWWHTDIQRKVNIFAHARRIDGSGKILAWSQLVSSGNANTQLEQRYDNSENWTRNLLLPTKAHEIGHALGLGHSQDPNALMYPSMNGTQKPGRWDIQAIQAKYGTPTDPPDSEDILGEYGKFTHNGYIYSLVQKRKRV